MGDLEMRMPGLGTPDGEKLSEPLDEKQLERLLQQELDETRLVDDYTTDINPFRSAVTYVIAGQVLTTITLQFLYLHYILPALGVMLTYLGMRTLRTGNRFFRAGWLASLAMVLMTAWNLLVSATPYLTVFGNALSWIGVGLTLLFLFCFGKGIQQAGRDAGMERPKMPTLPVMIWQVVVMGLAQVAYSGWFLVIAMLAAWVCMIRYICHCADDLQTVGYDVPAAGVRFSAKSLLLAYILVLAAALVILSWGVHHTPLTAEAVQDDGFGGITMAESGQGIQNGQSGNAADTAAIRARLEELGFAAEVLDGILDEDLTDLADAIAIQYGEKKQDEDGRMAGNTIAVLCSDGGIKCFTTFDYTGRAHSGLVDSVKLSCNRWEKLSAFQGRIFYEKGGQAYVAEVPLTEDSRTYLWFGEVTTDRWMEGKYSYPAFSKGQRGYFTWWSEREDGTPADYCMILVNYYNLTKHIVLPYMKLPYEDGGDMFSMGFGGIGEKHFQIYATPEFSR